MLLIAFHFPPSDAIGAQRPRGLVTYLPEFGWNPTVVTPADPLREAREDIVETGYVDAAARWKRRLLLKSSQSVHAQLGLSEPRGPNGNRFHTRLIHNVRSFLLYPDETKGWLPFAHRALRDLRNRRSFDAVLSTAHPISAHMIGAEAKRIFRCPWIADFRDLWVQNSNNATTALLRPFEDRFERRTLSQSDAMVTVSAYMSDLLRQRYPDHTISTITNGFCIKDFSLPSSGSSGAFSIVYTGQLYEGKRDPGLLLLVTTQLLRKGKLPRSDIRIHFYGVAEHWFRQRVRELSLEDVVELHGIVPRCEALQAQVNAQLLLLLNWEGADSAGIYTGKVFEYLGARRPILLLGGERGVLTELLKKTQAGVHLDNASDLETYLLRAYEEYRAKGKVTYDGIDQEVATYSHREMAKRFAALLDKVVDTCQGSPQMDTPATQAITCRQ